MGFDQLLLRLLGPAASQANQLRKREASRRLLEQCVRAALADALRLQPGLSGTTDDDSLALDDLLWGDHYDLPSESADSALALWDRLVAGVCTRLSILERVTAVIVDDDEIDGHELTQAQAIGITDTWQLAEDFVAALERRLHAITGDPALHEIWSKLSASRQQRVGMEVLISLDRIERQMAQSYDSWAPGEVHELSGGGSQLPAIWNVTYPRPLRMHLTAEAGPWLTATAPNSVNPVVRALVGIGGGGKTQLAVEYCYRRAATCDVVWWIDASTPETALAGLHGLANALGSPAGDTAGNVAFLHNRLARLDRWLIVFDDAAAPDTSTGQPEPFDKIQRLIPLLGSGEVVVTSIQRGWSAHAHALEVAPWELDDSVAFLGSQDPSGARRVAAELQGLPLALEHAAAYCRETGISFDEYCERLRGLGSDASSSLAPQSKTIQLAVREIRRHAGAHHLLAMTAYLHGADIPRSLFCTPLNDPSPVHFEDPATIDRIDQALRILFNFSLINFGASSVMVHRLVQLEVRRELTAEERELKLGWVLLTLHARSNARPDGESRWRALQLIYPHLIEASDHVSFPSVYGQVAIKTMYAVVPFLEKVGRTREMAAQTERVIAAAEKQGDLTEADLAMMRSTHAVALAASDQLSEAEAVMEPVLEWAEQAGSEDAAEAACILSNGAVLAGFRRRFEFAARLLEKAVSLEAAKLGSESIEISATYSNLGDALAEMGENGRARDALSRAYEIRSATLGVCDPDTQMTALRLADVLVTLDIEAGRAVLAKTEAALQSAIRQREPWCLSVLPRLVAASESYGRSEHLARLLEAWQPAMDAFLSPAGRCELRVRRGEAQSRSGDPSELFREAWNLSGELSDAEVDTVVTCGVAYASHLARSGCGAEARAVLDELYPRLAHLPEASATATQVAFLRGLASIASSPADSEHWLGIAADQIRRGAPIPPDSAVRVFHQLGLSHWNRGEIADAVIDIVSAYNLLVVSNSTDSQLVGPVLTSLGGALNKLENWPLAEAVLERAVTTLTLDDRLLGVTLGHLGVTYLSTDKPARAMSVLRDAVAAKLRGGDLEALASTYYNLADAHFRIRQFGPALRAVEEAARLEQTTVDRLDPTRLSTLILRARILAAIGSSVHKMIKEIEALAHEMELTPAQAEWVRLHVEAIPRSNRVHATRKKSRPRR